LLIIVSLFLQSARDYNSPAKRWFFGVCAGALSVLLAVILIGVLRDGGLGAFTSPFEFEKQSFLRDPNLAMLWVVVPTIWASAGPGCLIYLAALKGIPEEQYEAADLDGAGLWHKLVHVSYPNLKALIIINFIGAVVAGFKESMNIFVMTGGGPEDATMTTGLYIWYNAFMFLNFGLAAAMAWIMGAMLIGFTLWQLRILDKLQFRSAAVEEEMS
jgi:multiple sugar transport system permease protein